MAEYINKWNQMEEVNKGMKENNDLDIGMSAM